MYYKPTVHSDGEVTVQTLDWFVPADRFGLTSSPYSSVFLESNGWLAPDQYKVWREQRALVAKANQQSGINTDF
jgi:hypothetical protein